MQHHQAVCDRTSDIGGQSLTAGWLNWCRQQGRRLRTDVVFALVTDFIGHCLAALAIGGMLLAGVYLFLSQLAEYGW